MSIESEMGDLGLDHQAVRNLVYLRKSNKNGI